MNDAQKQALIQALLRMGVNQKMPPPQPPQPLPAPGGVRG